MSKRGLLGGLPERQADDPALHDCGHVRFPPTRFCSKCRSIKCEWIESKGEGRVFSWIVVRHPVPRDVYAQEVPYVVALIELEEGVRIPSNVIGCEPEDVSPACR